MNIRSALDDLLRTHHDRLSLMALHGYYGNGRGAIPLKITVIPFHDSNRGVVRISVRAYCAPAPCPNAAADLLEHVESYDPTDTGLLLFQVEPGEWSGCLAFSLAQTVRASYPA